MIQSPSERKFIVKRTEKKINKTRFVTRHRRWCSRVQGPAVWRSTTRRRFSVHAKVFSPTIRRYTKISRQHDSHGSTLTATAVSCHCLTYLQLCTLEKKKRPLHGKKMNVPETFSTPPEVGKHLDDKLLLIQTSPVDPSQLGCRVCYRRKMIQKKKKSPKFRIGSIRQ